MVDRVDFVDNVGLNPRGTPLAGSRFLIVAGQHIQVPLSGCLARLSSILWPAWLHGRATTE